MRFNLYKARLGNEEVEHEQENLAMCGSFDFGSDPYGG
jgi:hypothetical protein